jgi:hypothetical protein
MHPMATAIHTRIASGLLRTSTLPRAPAARPASALAATCRALSAAAPTPPPPAAALRASIPGAGPARAVAVLAPRIAPPSEAFFAEVERAVGAAHVTRDPSDPSLISASTDWLGQSTGRAAALICPGSVEEVAAVLRAAARARVAIVPQGGRTGLVAGGVPLFPDRREVVLGTTRLRDVR